MCKVFLSLTFFLICNYSASMLLQSECRAKDNMLRCFQYVKNGNIDNAYSHFIAAISDKDDDPGCYKTLSAIASIIPGSDVSEMWNEYGITDYARSVFLNASSQNLKAALKVACNT